MSEFEKKFPKPKEPNYATQIADYGRQMIIWNYRKQGALWALNWYIEIKTKCMLKGGNIDDYIRKEIIGIEKENE